MLKQKAEETKQSKEMARLKAIEERQGKQEFNLSAIINPTISPEKKKAVAPKTAAEREAEYIKRYGPDTEFNRIIVRGSTYLDRDDKKWKCRIVCSHPGCDKEREVASSDLFQTQFCAAHQQEKRRKNQKKKRSVKKSSPLEELVAKRKTEVAKKREESLKRARGTNV